MDKDIILGGGCFWCIEAVFQRVIGVHSVTSGYTDGHVENPTYKDICSGASGHNEVIKVVYDDTIISLQELLEIFWAVHNPTTLNRQGADKGTQYRSGIYCNTDQDLEIATKSKDEVATKLWDDPIVTEIKASTKFYPAEKYHHDYYNRNSYTGYCQVVINPKLSTLRKSFSSKIKAEYSEKA